MTKLDLKKFEKKMIIRNTRHSDIDHIIALQELCFPGMIPWKKDQLESHLDIFPKASLLQNMMGKSLVRAQALLLILMNMMIVIPGMM